MFKQTIKTSFMIFSAMMTQHAFAGDCPSLQGFYVQDPRLKTHFEYYDVLTDGKIDRFHYRGFDSDGTATKVEFLADGKTYRTGKNSEATAKCANGEFLRTMHSWTEKDADFPGGDFIDSRRTRKDADGNLSVFIDKIYKTTDGFYDEQRLRIVFKGYDGVNFPKDDREYTVVPFPSLRGGGTGHPDEGMPSLLDYLWVDGKKMSASFDQREMSMLYVDPKTMKVRGYYRPEVKFAFANAHGEAPAAGRDFTLDMDWDPSVIEPTFTTWKSSYEQCEIESSKKSCQHKRYDTVIGELRFGTGTSTETLTDVLDSQTTEIADPDCCKNL